MGINKNKRSVAIFYDGNYLARVSKYYGSNNIVKYRFNIDALHHYIKTEIDAIASDLLSECYIASSHYFRSRHSAQEAIHRKNQLYRDRVNDDLLRSLNIESHFTPFSMTTNSGDDAYICNWLSLELIEETIAKEFDFVVLVAGSRAYLPLIHKLNVRGIDTMVVGWDIDMYGDGVDIKTDDQLFDAAEHTIVVNVAIDQTPDSLTNLLTPLPSSNRSQESKTAGNHVASIEIEDNGEREISEILTLKPNFGFIRFPDNNLFFRSSDFIGNFNELKVGDTVEFMVDLSVDGQNTAKKVTKVESNLHLFEDDDELYKIDENFIDWEK